MGEAKLVPDCLYRACELVADVVFSHWFLVAVVDFGFFGVDVDYGSGVVVFELAVPGLDPFEVHVWGDAVFWARWVDHGSSFHKYG